MTKFMDDIAIFISLSSRYFPRSNNTSFLTLNVLNWQNIFEFVKFQIIQIDFKSGSSLAQICISVIGASSDEVYFHAFW